MKSFYEEICFVLVGARFIRVFDGLGFAIHRKLREKFKLYGLGADKPRVCPLMHLVQTNILPVLPGTLDICRFGYFLDRLVGL